MSAPFDAALAIVGVNEDGSLITRNIEDLAVGDEVLARNELDAGDDVEFRGLTEVFERTSDHIRVLTLRDAEGNEQTIRTTDEHPFYVPGIGWVSAGELRAGMKLSELDGSNDSVIVGTSREEHPEGIKVYNLEVSGDRTYFVADESGNAVWVHNKYEIVPRFGMGKSTKFGTIIYGAAQATSGSHAKDIAAFAQKLAKSGKYEYVVLNRSWRTASGKAIKSRLRPDVIAVGKNGKISAWEFQSKTDIARELKAKLDVVKKSIPANSRGVFRVFEL